MLLSTIRFRIAFRSPGIGGLPVGFGGGLDLIRADFFCPFFVSPLSFFIIGIAFRTEDVEKVLVLGAKRHFQLLRGVAMVVVVLLIS